MNALELVQDVVRQIGVTEVPSSLVGTTDPQITNLVALLNRVGRLIVSRHDWTVLGDTFSFASDGTNPQTEALPSDWRKAYPNASVWRSGTDLTPLNGPASPDVWHELESLPGIRFPGFWRLFAGNMEIIGVPSGETVTLEYVRTTWVIAADATRKTAVTADADTFVFSDDLLSLGLIYTWLKMKRLPYADEMADYENKLAEDRAADRSARPFSTTSSYQRQGSYKPFAGVITP